MTWSDKLFAINRVEEAQGAPPVAPLAPNLGSDHAPLARVVVVADRDEAVSWVRDHLGEGDTVLYENDLPDHFP